MSERSEIIWRPTPAFAERTRIAQFMQRLGIASLAELQRRSIEDPEWYWKGVSEEFALRWTKPFRRVLDAARGLAWPRWFEGGEFNLAANCLDRNLDAGRGAQPALIWESDSGETRALSYAELTRETARLASGLRGLGVSAGETTDDGAFTLETDASVGAGAIAPAVRIDTLVYGPLNVDEARHLIYARRAEKTRARKVGAEANA